MTHDEEMKKISLLAKDTTLRKWYGVDHRKLTPIGAIKNNDGCLMLYKDTKDVFWKKQVHYTLTKDGRMIPTKKQQIKRQYKKKTVMPQCY